MAHNANRSGRRDLPRILLDWYDRHGRALPWRAKPGKRTEPYRVWLSEIMLQQTTVATVGPYYRDFLKRWPNVEALAGAALDDVLHGWQGLGYYARARNMHRCARVVADEFGGEFPADEAMLLKLPGIGPYTAAAIAAIAFDMPTTPVDGNVERVIARLRGIETPLPAAKPEITEAARALTPTERPGDYVQAVMDLGSTTCTPRRPACERCPWSGACVSFAAGDPEKLPRKTPRPERPTRRGIAFWATGRDGAVLLRRRPEKGLLGGMMEIPSTEWREAPWPPRAALGEAPFAADWRMLPGTVRHTFTHFHLEMEIMAAPAEADAAEGIWCPVERLGEHALPTIMKKLVRHALARA